MKIYIQSPRWGGTTILRQSEDFSGLIGTAQWSPFPDDDYDWLLCDDPRRLPPRLKAEPRSKRVFIMAENPMVWSPSRDYLSQFGVVISPFELDLPSDVRFIQTQPAIAWFYGIPFRTDCGLIHQPTRSAMELRTIRNRYPFQKTKLISCIVSGKAGLPGHRWRIEVAQELSKYFGSAIDIFGFGHKPLADKSDALDEYVYTVVIENHSAPHYWTEKLSDSLLGGCIPLYAGAPNITSYFNLDIPLIEHGCSPAAAVALIKAYIANCQLMQSELKGAMDAVTDRYNILSYLPSVLL